MLRPFFSYYGGKWRAAPLYPKPEYDWIVEPFAGSAGYSLRYPDRKVTLYDINPRVVGVWDFLIKSTPAEILKIPLMEKDQRLGDLRASCEEARWLVGLWTGHPHVEPNEGVAYWGRKGPRTNHYVVWSEKIRARIAEQVSVIKHWRVYERTYLEIPNARITYFIDPPYNNKAGREYTFSKIDYAHLGEWCRTRLGQTIVCENTGASWLPFTHFLEIPGSAGKSAEAIWTQHKTSFEVSL